MSVRFNFNNNENLSPSTLALMQRKFDEAAVIWTRSQPSGLNLQFDFKAVVNDSNAVSATLVDEETRGPYDMTWSTQWEPEVIAHELGHVMGLTDEYSQLRVSFGIGSGENRSRCSYQSIMCNSYAKPQPIHYYIILRRAVLR